MAHQAKNGWHFERQADGGVHVRRTAAEWFDPIVTFETFTKDEWTALVEAMTAPDAEPTTFAQAVAAELAAEEFEGPPAPDEDDDETT